MTLDLQELTNEELAEAMREKARWMGEQIEQLLCNQRKLAEAADVLMAQPSETRLGVLEHRKAGQPLQGGSEEVDTPSPEGAADLATPQSDNGESSDEQKYMLSPGEDIVFKYIAENGKTLVSSVRRVMAENNYKETSAYGFMGMLRDKGLVWNPEKGAPYELTSLGRRFYEGDQNQKIPPVGVPEHCLKAISAGFSTRSDLSDYLEAEGLHAGNMDSALSRLRRRGLIVAEGESPRQYMLTKDGREAASGLA